MRSALKWIAGVLGVLIGSGVWEWILKPLLLFGGDTILTVTTLGLDKFRDNLYASVAIASQERASVMSLYLIMLVILLILSVPLVNVLKLRRITRENYREYLGRNSESWQKRWLNIALFPAMGIMISAYFGLLYQTTYISRANAHLSQLQRIISPFVTEQQRLIFSSRAAQMTTRAEFQKLLIDLTDVATANGAKTPSFATF